MTIQDRVEARRRPDPVGGPTGGAPAPGTDRLPRPPGRRRPGLAALGVLLIVLGGAVAGLLALRIDERVPVLVARQDIPVGQQITAADLSVARIATEGITVIPQSRADEVIGRYAATRITRGRLVDTGMLSSSGLLTAGNAAVGIALQPGRFPASGLESGDVVQVVRAVDGEGQVIAERAVVGSVKSPSDSVFGASSSDTVVVTVVVPQRSAAAVAAAASADQVSLVLLTRGEPVGSG